MILAAEPSAHIDRVGWIYQFRVECIGFSLFKIEQSCCVIRKSPKKFHPESYVADRRGPYFASDLNASATRGLIRPIGELSWTIQDSRRQIVCTYASSKGTVFSRPLPRTLASHDLLKRREELSIHPCIILPERGGSSHGDD